MPPLQDYSTGNCLSLYMFAAGFAARIHLLSMSANVFTFAVVSSLSFGSVWQHTGKQSHDIGVWHCHAVQAERMRCIWFALVSSECCCSGCKNWEQRRWENESNRTAVVRKCQDKVNVHVQMWCDVMSQFVIRSCPSVSPSASPFVCLSFFLPSVCLYDRLSAHLSVRLSVRRYIALVIRWQYTQPTDCPQTWLFHRFFSLAENAPYNIAIRDIGQQRMYCTVRPSNHHF